MRNDSQHRTEFETSAEFAHIRPDHPGFIVLNFLVAKRCAVHRFPHDSPWANALEVSIYTGVEEGTAATLLRHLAKVRKDVAYTRSGKRTGGRESWCIVAERDGLVFLDERRPSLSRSSSREPAVGSDVPAGPWPLPLPDDA